MLKSRQKKFIANYVQIGNITHTCEEMGITRQTYYNWLKNPEFMKSLVQYKTLYSDFDAIMYSKQLFNMAMETSKDLLDSSDEPTKLKTVIAIIEKVKSMVMTKELDFKYNTITNQL